MARNAKSNSKRNSRKTATRRLSHRGATAVALTVACLVLLAGCGHAAVALLGFVALYVLVIRGAAVRPGSIPAPRRTLRALAWLAVATAVLASVQGSTAPGGATLGLALAAGLATALKLRR